MRIETVNKQGERARVWLEDGTIYLQEGEKRPESSGDIYAEKNALYVAIALSPFNPENR